MYRTSAASALVPAAVRGRGPFGRFLELVREGCRKYIVAFRRAPVAVLAGTVMFAILTLGGAYAAWLSSTQSSASVTAATVNQATAPTVGYTSGDVEVSWAPVALSGGAPVDSYDVVRHDGGSSSVVCTVSAPATSCQDPSPVAGTVDYGVIARMSQNWTGPESPLTSFTSDQALPTTNASTAPAPNAAGWHSTAVTVTLTASDSGASGLRSITYRVGAGAPVTVNASSTSFSVSIQGTTAVTFYAEDYAGNVESSNALMLKIDSVAPGAPSMTSISNDTGVSSSDRITSASSQTISGTAEAGSTVTIKRGATTLGTGTANGSGAFAVPVTLVDGVNTFTATATDVADNVSDASASFAVTLDQTNPATSASASPAPNGAGWNNSAVTVTLTASDTGGSGAQSITYQVGAGSPVTGTGSSVSFLVTAQGTTNVSFWATDVAGNVESTKSTVLKIDSVAPAAPSMTSISNDTGVSSSDRVTSAASQTISGTAEAGSAVTIKRGATTLGTGTANGSGAFAVPVTLMDGVNTLTATAADVADNVSDASASFAVTLDQTNPVTSPSVSPSPNGAGWNNTAVTVTLTASDTGGSGAQSITYQVGAGSPVTVTGSSTSFPITAQGTTNVSFWATDVAGNVESTKNTAVKIDSIAPATPSMTSISNDTGVSSTDRITSAASQTISGTAEAGSTVTIKRGATTLGTGTANGSGAFAVPVTLVDGVNTLTATATDAADNVSAVPASLAVTLDQTNPVTSPSVSPTPNAAGWNNTAVTVTLTASDTGGSGPQSITYRIGAASPVTVTGSSTSFPITAQGTTSVTFWATDVAGNVESTKTQVVRIDTVAPATPTITGISNDTGVSATDRITNAVAQNITGSAEAGSTVTVRSGAVVLGTATANGSGTYSVPVTLADGANTLTATATDLAGNVSATSSTFVVRVDRAAPLVAITFPLPGGSYSNSDYKDGCGKNTRAICGTASDPSSAYTSGLASTTLKVQTGTTCLNSGGGWDSAACSVPLTLNPSPTWLYSTGTLSTGTYTATVTATDVAGNVTTTSVTWDAQ